MDYQLVKNCLSSDAVNILYHTMMLTKIASYEQRGVKQSDITSFGDVQIKNSFGVYGIPFIDALLPHLQQKMEKFAGTSLFPTYAFSRMCFPGAVLERHTDRPACQFSATICIHNDPEPWPIFMDGNRIVLEPGDAVFYRGRKIPHWREPFTGKRQVQIYLHYVDVHGPYKDCKFDERKFLGLPGVPAEKKIQEFL